MPVELRSLDALVALGREVRPDLTVVGPELPLTLGVVDEFLQRGWPIFGPTKAGAQLEGSKSFAKEFLQRHQIPTAAYAVCNSVQEVHSALALFHAPVVVKADGLAAGKGVVIAASKEEAASAAAEMLSGKMVGEAGTRVVLEEFLTGDELSFLVLSDGERVAPLVAARDHKRVGDGDAGPNTGGMGAYTTADIVDENMRDWLVNRIARPVVAGMKAEGAEYKGANPRRSGRILPWPLPVSFPARRPPGRRRAAMRARRARPTDRDNPPPVGLPAASRSSRAPPRRGRCRSSARIGRERLGAADRRRSTGSCVTADCGRPRGATKQWSFPLVAPPT